jgi:hypothetical protein
MDDWIDLLKKFTPDDVARASKQYVLNHSQFKKPDLFKFKEIINNSCQTAGKVVVFNEKWPKYFLQCTDDSSKYWKKGTFTETVPAYFIPDLAMKCCQNALFRQANLYGGQWQIVVCDNRNDWYLLCESRLKPKLQRDEQFGTKKTGIFSQSDLMLKGQI